MANRCGICGGPDQRHRMVDSQMERVIAGDTIDEVAADYEWSVPQMVKFWFDAYGAAINGWWAELNDGSADA